MAIEPETIPSGSGFVVSSPNVQYRQDLSRLIPSNSDQPLFLAYDLALTTAVPTLRISCEGGIPQRWIVSIVPATGIAVAVYLGPEASGSPIRLTGGGVIQIPSFDEYITLVLTTGASATGNVLALRKYDFIEISSGVV
jgi:hypothetical protein